MKYTPLVNTPEKVVHCCNQMRRLIMDDFVSTGKIFHANFHGNPSNKFHDGFGRFVISYCLFCGEKIEVANES